jgi:nucleotide-binding universal stress UspA family protein
MWATNHPDSALTAQQKTLDLLQLVPEGTKAEVRLTHGPVTDSVLAVAREVAADLAVLSTRGEPTEDNESVTERVLERATLPVLAVHSALQDHATPRFSAGSDTRQTLLVPTDLTPASDPALTVAFELARRFAFDVHVVHVVSSSSKANGDAAAEIRRRMATTMPPGAPDWEGHVEAGEPATAIARLADKMAASCIVMGEHLRTPLRYWFRRGTSLGILHRAPCPIWYVPDPATVEAAAAKEALRNQLSSAARPAEAPQSLLDELRSRTFQYWPTSYLYAVVDTPEAAEPVLADLIATGVPKDHIRTWYGHAGKTAIDSSGEHHTRTARLWRALEKATGERELLDRYADEIERGHVCLGVRCGSREARDILASILQKHGARMISFFSIGSVERLSA